MNNTQDQNKPVRPSLYGSQTTASTFSVLSSVTSVGWSKQNVVLASVASFIVGGVMGGGVVGFATQSETIPASTISSPSLNAQAAQQESPKTSPQVVKKTIVESPVVSTSVDKVSSPIPSEVGFTKPLNNPLASFKETNDKENTVKESLNKNSSEPKQATLIHKPTTATHSDDLAMQKLIEKKSIDKQAFTKNQLEKKKIEQAFEAERPIKNIHMNKESNPSKALIKPKKDNARDKDVLLVKSMLDTMDHPVSKAKNPPLINPSTTDPQN